jgi:hypothetical protein
LWEVKKGEGDKKGGDTTPPDGSTDTAKGKGKGHGSTEGSSGEDPDASDTPLLSALLDLPKYKGWKEGKGNDTISDDMKDKFKIMTDANDVDHIISPEFPPEFELALKGSPEMRAFKKYVVVKTEGGDVAYYELAALKAIKDPSAPAFPMSGNYTKSTNSMDSVRDLDVAEDIIHESMKKDVDLKPGVDKFGSGGKYLISGGGKGDKFLIRLDNRTTKKDCDIYPTMGTQCTGSQDPATAKPQKAPDQAADADDGKPKAYEGCRKEIQEADGTIVSVYAGGGGTKMAGATKDNDACLYEHRNGSKPSTYTLAVNYANEDGATASPEQAIFGEGLPKPAQFFYKSLGAKEAKSTPSPQIRKVDGSDASRGVYGLFQSGDGSHDAPLKDKAGDCLGAVVWWGQNDSGGAMSDADALKLCQDRIIQSPASWKNLWHWF